jgi:hypothetical protein
VSANLGLLVSTSCRRYNIRERKSIMVYRFAYSRGLGACCVLVFACWLQRGPGHGSTCLRTVSGNHAIALYNGAYRFCTGQTGSFSCCTWRNSMLLSSTKSTCLFTLLAPHVNHVLASVEFSVQCLDFNLMLNSCYRNMSGSLHQEL